MLKQRGGGGSGLGLGLGLGLGSSLSVADHIHHVLDGKERTVGSHHNSRILDVQ